MRGPWQALPVSIRRGNVAYLETALTLRGGFWCCGGVCPGNLIGKWRKEAKKLDRFLDDIRCSLRCFRWLSQVNRRVPTVFDGRRSCFSAVVFIRLRRRRSRSCDGASMPPKIHPPEGVLEFIHDDLEDAGLLGRREDREDAREGGVAVEVCALHLEAVDGTGVEVHENDRMLPVNVRLKFGRLGEGLRGIGRDTLLVRTRLVERSCRCPMSRSSGSCSAPPGEIATSVFTLAMRGPTFCVDVEKLGIVRETSLPSMVAPPRSTL